MQKDEFRTGLSARAFKEAFLDRLLYSQGKFCTVATKNDKYLALAGAVRDRLIRRWVASGETYYKARSRTVCYLSAEYLLGPHLGNNLLNLGVREEVEAAMKELDLDLRELLDQEEEPGLGNGGLGRLAACFMESLATLQIPTLGYGIRYEFGIFDQSIVDGAQHERTDKWLRMGNPWEIAHPEIFYAVKLGGHTEAGVDAQGRFQVRWVPARVVRGVAYDTPILGYRVTTANVLRLWRAEAEESFDFQAFNEGDYWGAVEDKVGSENITKVLYPNDETVGGKRLRLEQQYFFVSCSLQDMIRIHRQTGAGLETFHEKYAAQLNDTHPAVAVAELMRLLVDEHSMAWEQAWEITRRTFGYTNHTLLPEALEKWPVELFKAVLPRHLDIIYEINARFLREVAARFPGDTARLARMSLIDESGTRAVRMANLACVGSHAINGVASLHTRLLKAEVLHDFAELWPEKFSNKTNGVTPRRFVALINPGLTKLLDRVAGKAWPADLSLLRKLEPLADDRGFQDEWRAVKAANKKVLADFVARRQGIKVDPASLFDILVKRIHEYKRQHLDTLHVIAMANRIVNDPRYDAPPRTVFFGGKAAPGYRMAKLMIRLVHGVAEAIDRDPRVRERLKVVFMPDYNVKNCQPVFPAADLSEQISTAGKEASGTGCMKFIMNGAITIGTLDGANVEILEEVGAENFFLFGLRVEEVQAMRRQGYRPRDFVERDPELALALDQIASGVFSRGDREVFAPLVSTLLERDPFFLLADFRSYVDTQDRVGRTYQDLPTWTRMSILNSARSGKFSSDRTIREYCKEIWRVEPKPVVLQGD